MTRLSLPSVWVAALACALPVRAEIVINEIMYNTPGSPDVEYVELVNAGAEPQGLDGWYLLDDDNAHTACVLAGTLDPGAFLVVAGSLAAFAAAYPDVTTVNPTPFGSDVPGQGFGLGNAGDTVRLFDGLGRLVDTVAYRDLPPWPVEADGDGPSLELRNPAADNADPVHWGASAGGPPFGSPGARNSIFAEDLPPAVSDVSRDIPLPTADTPVTVTARVSDDGGLTAVDLLVESRGDFYPVAMADDGLHGDAEAGDSIWGASIEPRPSGSVVRYYVAATDTSGQTATGPANAPAEFFAYTVDYRPPPLVISELLAANVAVNSDGDGDFDDWVELRNPGPDAVDLKGMYLSDALGDSRAWSLPGTWIAAGERLLIWCDGEPDEGPFHATFRLSRAGGEVGLFDSVEHGNLLIHGLTYGPQNADVSFGFLPDDSDAPEYLASPTPGAENAASSLYSAVCVNEFLAASEVGVPDWIELYNRGSQTVDISGWFLSDDAALPARYALPQGTVLAPGEFVAIDEVALGFGLAADGDELIVLTSGDGTIGQDYFDFGPQLPDISQGRFADGTPYWQSFSSWTLAAPNRCAPAGNGPAPVTGLRFTARDAVAWEPVAGADRYDLLVGDLASLRASGGGFDAAGLACREDQSADARGWVPEDPQIGAGRFYLVRAVDLACGFGSYDSGGAAQVASRDGEIAQAAGVCP